ncbi:hypothetical protein AB0K60_31465 [Thermopolyspora sp. NPDC052614]|uniref:hypothetical protein n=1 Tax=Thermopolyspora sp. NPDC052614 TaxID=3155682 RepID=UPI0034295CAC
MTSHRGGSRRRRPVLLPVTALLAATGLAVSAALGGFDEAPKPAPESLGKGGVLDQERISTEFQDAVVRPGGQGIGVSDKRYLQIHLRVTNLSDETVSAFSMIDSTMLAVRTDGKTIMTSGQTGANGPRIGIPIDGRVFDQLHPRVPTPVVVAIELPADGTPPHEVRIDAGTFELRNSFFTDTPEWSVVQESTLPVEGESNARSVKKVAATVTLPVRVEAGG